MSRHVLGHRGCVPFTLAGKLVSLLKLLKQLMEQEMSLLSHIILFDGSKERVVETLLRIY